VLVQPWDRIFGRVASLSHVSGHWLMRFDPEWFTSGVTANVAAAADGVVAPGEPVPNDNYRVDEGHRLLTYLVAPGAHVTVLTRHGSPAQPGRTTITVPQLAALVRKKPIALFEPLRRESGSRPRRQGLCDRAASTSRDAGTVTT
jgi:hypothetical protein